MSSRYKDEELEILQELGIYCSRYEDVKTYPSAIALNLVTQYYGLDKCSTVKLEKYMKTLIDLCDDTQFVITSYLICRLEDRGWECLFHTEKTLRRMIELCGMNTCRVYAVVCGDEDMRTNCKNAIKLLLESDTQKGDLRASLRLRASMCRLVEHTFAIDMIIESMF